MGDDVKVRRPEEIQREIEVTRARLAGNIDELTGRSDPRRVATHGVTWIRTSDQGRLVVGASSVIVLALGVLIVLRGNKRRAQQKNLARALATLQALEVLGANSPLRV